MNTHVLQSFSGFLHHFVMAKLITCSIRVKAVCMHHAPEVLCVHTVLDGLSKLLVTRELQEIEKGYELS